MMVNSHTMSVVVGCTRDFLKHKFINWFNTRTIITHNSDKGSFDRTSCISVGHETVTLIRSSRNSTYISR